MTLSYITWVILSPMTGTGTMIGRTLGADTAAAGAGLTFSTVVSELVGISVTEISILYSGLPTLIYS